MRSLYDVIMSVGNALKIIQHTHQLSINELKELKKIYETLTKTNGCSFQMELEILQCEISPSEFQSKLRLLTEKIQLFTNEYKTNESFWVSDCSARSVIGKISEFCNSLYNLKIEEQLEIVNHLLCKLKDLDSLINLQGEWDLHFSTYREMKQYLSERCEQLHIQFSEENLLNERNKLKKEYNGERQKLDSLYDKKREEERRISNSIMYEGIYQLYLFLQEIEEIATTFLAKDNETKNRIPRKKGRPQMPKYNTLDDFLQDTGFLNAIEKQVEVYIRDSKSKKIDIPFIRAIWEVLSIPGYIAKEKKCSKKTFFELIKHKFRDNCLDFNLNSIDHPTRDETIYYQFKFPINKMQSGQ